MIRRAHVIIASTSCALIACGSPSSPDATPDARADASDTISSVDVPPESTIDASADHALDAADAVTVDHTDAIEAADVGADVPPPCTTRVTYGSAWIRPTGHPTSFDDVAGVITWDGTCANDAGGNSFATLSNGWMPYFAGRDACVIELDYATGCAGVPSACATRVTYGSAWLRPAGHPSQYDDVAGVLAWNGTCHASGAQSFAALSNGWTPYFTGANACALSFRYEQCNGLYANPVVATECPDPGVLHDGAQYVMACTSGNAPDAYPVRTSPDLVNWTSRGFIFPAGRGPSWASGDFWAPEIHRVGAGYVAYFSARNAADGRLSIGAASATSPLGPFTDLGHPLVHDATLGLIDAHEFEAPDGTRYVLWKVDGNAVGQPTPIRIQPLAPDGLSLVGAPTTLITNDQPWEGAVVEGPWMIEQSGTYYLFYSGNGYASASYAIGVARAASPLGPFAKAPQPILVTDAAWQGPGHGSVVLDPGGQTVFVFHAWQSGHIGGAPGREVLVDRVLWNAGWPSMLAAPSARSAPMP